MYSTRRCSHASWWVTAEPLLGHDLIYYGPIRAEKMRIGDEPGRTFIRELSETFSDNARTATHLNMKVNNGQDFSNLASFIYCIRYLPDERVHATKVKLETFLAEKRTFSDELQSRIRAALDDFWTIVRDHPNPFVIVKQKVAPIECIFICTWSAISLRLRTDEAVS